MRANGTSDFAALLDELIAASLSEPEGRGRPTIPFDYLSVADELHSGRIRVSPDAVAAEYRAADATADARSPTPEAATAADTARDDALPSTDPQAIWNELGLAQADPEELGRKRRIFAFRNHPDRVAPHLRQRAMVRMQVANMMIDELERKVKRTGR